MISLPVPPLWSGLELLTALGARAHGGLPDVATGASIDTRTLDAGDLFFAIKGESRDGHEFVENALSIGAAAAVVDEAHAGDLGKCGPLLFVPDVLDAMMSAGHAARARTAARIVAVTGSVGKTSTKEALKLALSGQRPAHASAASYNNHWGVPLSLARMPRDASFGVFEIGMSAPGEIEPLTRLVRPHVAIVTTVAPVHLEFFPSLDAIADAKAEIFSGIESGGTAIVNRDIEQYGRLAASAAASPATRVISFGEHEEADIRLLSMKLMSEMSLVEAQVLGAPVSYRLGTPGRHLVLNSLAVLGAVAALGLDVGEAAERLGELAAAVGRGARSTHTVMGGRFLLIDESYNANPASMAAALETLGQAPVGTGGRRIAVLSDMLELGAEGPSLHAALARPIEANQVDLVFAAGPLMKQLWQALPADKRAHYAEAPALLEAAVLDAVRAGDTIMVKGSNGTRISRLVAALKSWFPAAAELADASAA